MLLRTLLKEAMFNGTGIMGMLNNIKMDIISMTYIQCNE
jgi:hypothetical protein